MRLSWLDSWVRLLDVTPDGSAFNLMSPGLDVLRASYRDLKKGRQLLMPNRRDELHLDNLITSNVFQGPSDTECTFPRPSFQIFAQPANRRAGKFVGQNAEGEHFNLFRRLGILLALFCRSCLDSAVSTALRRGFGGLFAPSTSH